MYCFHRCVSVHIQAGTPSSPIILPLVPCPFQECPSDWSQVPSWGIPRPGPDRGVPQSGPDGAYPSQVQIGHTPAGSRWGVPQPVWMGGTLARDGVPPVQVRYPPSRDGVSLARDRVPPRIGQQMDYLIRGGQYASCVHAGGLLCSRLKLQIGTVWIITEILFFQLLRSDNIVLQIISKRSTNKDYLIQIANT